MDDYTRHVVDSAMRINLLRMIDEYRECRCLGLYWAASGLLLEIRSHLDAFNGLAGVW